MTEVHVSASFQLTSHWPLSPLKVPAEVQKSPPTILEINFSDNEDEEYKPTREELEVGLLR